jgi:hypothetical protein
MVAYRWAEFAIPGLSRGAPNWNAVLARTDFFARVDLSLPTDTVSGRVSID